MGTLLVIGLLFGLIIGYYLSSFFNNARKRRQIKEQSVILLEKIKQVCKLITIEGEFSEIISHRDEKPVFFNLVQLEKKALIIVKAKVLVGFDLTKIKIDVDTSQKIISLTGFPLPEVLSMDTDIEYYDIQKGIINKFSETELNKLSQRAKEHIRNKVKESGLLDIARQQAFDTISIIENIASPTKWKVISENKKELGKEVK